MSASVEAGDFTLAELVDLALCSPEVGAVNFNILRILLHEVLAKLGIVEQRAVLSDVESHQINNFKNYIQGAGTASPMPGVLRYAPGTTVQTDPLKTPRTAREEHRSSTPSSSRSAPGAPNQGSNAGPNQNQGYNAGPNQGYNAGPNQGHNPGPNQGHDAGTNQGHDTGTNQGYNAGTNQGHNAGPNQGHNAGPNQGYNAGPSQGHSAGPNQGNSARPSQGNRAGSVPMGSPPPQSIGVYARQSYVDQEQDVQFTPLSQMSPIIGSPSEPIEKKVARLERHLEALYALPTNSKLLGTGAHENDDTDRNLSVNDMWQIIQLNNRVAAAEAAIQKMASLIEELASQIKTLKKGSKATVGMQKEVENLARTNSDLALQMEPCMEKCERTAETVFRMKQDLEKIKKHLLEEINKLYVAAGLDPTTTPSFMEPRKSMVGRLSQEYEHSGGTQGQRHFGGAQDMRHSGTDPSGRLNAAAGAGTPGLDGKYRVNMNFGMDGKPLIGDEQFKLLTLPARVDSQGRIISEVHWVDADGQPVVHEYDENGLPIIFGPDGKRIMTNADLQYDSDGQAMFFGANGQRIFGMQGIPGIGPDGKPIITFPPLQHGGLDGEEGDRSSDMGSPGSSAEKGQRGSSEMITDDDVNGPHGRHPDTGNLTDAHPDARHQGISHVPVDVSGVPLEDMEIDPFTDFQYPTILPDGTVVPGKVDKRYEEECKDQADIVQKELQEQYVQLQDMQRQMAAEIQDKMEMVYQKLLREISAQHTTTSPYMAVGLNAEKCLGPGVCTGFGLPSGTAVCQFPQKPEKVDVCPKQEKVCPGRDVCPGKEVCPTCKDDILHHLRVPESRVTPMEYPKLGLSSSKENLLRQMTSMTLLPRDLEELREKLRDRGTVPDVFDEADVLEKLQTVWEAVSIIKNNEENMAVRLVQQDAIIKKIPQNAIEKLGRLSDAELGKLDADGQLKGLKGMKDLTGEDVQLIFNNLSSLVLENGAMKEKLQKINDTLNDFERNVVTKPMLMNALNDKVDKGQMHTKVSYDEYGAGMDEVQSRLGNLLQEVYRKNELWKELTDQMREDLGGKLDKVEIGPLRAYFKNHLGKLQEKVHHLTQIMEEPDPAGTRKKLLKDYNCISCDRHTNISGLTNAPQLPTFGPILAGHSTASQRAFELYRMRPQTSRYDSEGRNYCQMERQGRGDANMNGSMPLNSSDVMHLVNRYVGGSHTSISPQERIAALQKRVSVASAGKQSLTPEAPRPRTSVVVPPAAYYYDE